MAATGVSRDPVNYLVTHEKGLFICRGRNRHSEYISNITKQSVIKNEMYIDVTKFCLQNFIVNVSLLS